jgi:hypothetical protein
MPVGLFACSQSLPIVLGLLQERLRHLGCLGYQIGIPFEYIGQDHVAFCFEVPDLRGAAEGPEVGLVDILEIDLDRGLLEWPHLWTIGKHIEPFR